MPLARLVAFPALRELIPFFPVYALLFTDTGLGTTQISSLFVIWSVSSLLFELPSGVWADVTSRRLLLVVSAVAYAGAFTVWTLWHSYAGFALGFVAWSLSSACASGTYEAYTYDLLDRAGAISRYSRVISHATTSALVFNLLATVVAAPLFHLGGYAAVGVASVSVALVQAAVGLSLPRDVPDHDRSGERPGILETFRTGAHEATRSPAVRTAVLLAALLSGFLSFDEYFPVVAAGLGADTGTVPYLIAGTVAAQALGAAVAPHVSPPRVPTLLVVAGVTIGFGVLTGRPSGFVAIAVGYGLLQLAIVVAEVRLQHAIEGRARATVTSFARLSSDVFAIGTYALFGIGGFWLSVSTLVAMLAGLLLITTAATARWWRRSTMLTTRDL